MLTYLLTTFSALVSFAAMTGVLLHETRLDKVAVMAGAPVVSQAASTSSHKSPFASETHTHVERSAFSQAARTYQNSTPAYPAHNAKRKHMLQRNAPKGHHPFDNYHLPVVE